MDNIEHIHIAKVPYTIEPKAKTELRKYLADIRSHLDVDTADEVLHDIESRIPELLAQHHTKQGDVVTQADVQFVKKQLGEPEQFTNDEGRVPGSGSATKKLFRDNDNAMLGGVASGIGTYFSIDANIVRVAFFALAFFYGFGVILYLFLWLLLPEAKTSAEKLMMAGKPITASTLQRYRASVNSSIGSGPRILRTILRKFFRFLSVVITSVISLYLLCCFALVSALFYVYPFRGIVSGYSPDYIALGLMWLICLSFIGLLVLITMKIWGHASSRINLTAIGLGVLLIATIAGESATGLLIYNHFSNEYGGDKSTRSLDVSIAGSKAPKTLNVNADGNLDLIYNVTDQPLHATYTAYPAMNRPDITIDESKGIITINASQLYKAAPDCLGSICKNIYLPVHVQLYGPNLQNYDDNAGAQLTVNGDNFGSIVTFNAKDSSTINVNNGNADTMGISASAEGTVNTNNTTTQNADVTVDNTSNVSSPLISSTLNLTLPGDCATMAPSSDTTFSTGSLVELPQLPVHATINGQPQTMNELQQNNCLQSSF